MSEHAIIMPWSCGGKSSSASGCAVQCGCGCQWGVANGCSSPCELVRKQSFCGGGTECFDLCPKDEQLHRLRRQNHHLRCQLQIARGGPCGVRPGGLFASFLSSFRLFPKTYPPPPPPAPRPPEPCDCGPSLCWEVPDCATTLVAGAAVGGVLGLRCCPRPPDRFCPTAAFEAARALDNVSLFCL